MKNKIGKYLLLFFSIVLTSFADSFTQVSPTNFKVMTYNIWNGFDWGKDTLRKENWIRWIQDKNPDVLALQELCGYDEEQLKADAKKWGHNYVKILKTEGYPTGLTSKKPISLKERLTDELWHGMLHCTTYGIDFFVLHLSPADSDFRFNEANIIAKKVKAIDSDNYIILGDFNAHSPFDHELMKQNQALLEKYSKNNSDKYSNLRLGEFDYSVVSTFIALPAIDVSKDFVDIDSRFTFPAPVLIGSYRESMDEVIQSRERIDYIFTSPIIAKKCTNVTVFNTAETEHLSDHFPVMAEFELTLEK
ncbi:MAG: endonuclease/exonuclease/phosphatase family protein [Bacteroidota bacterium]